MTILPRLISLALTGAIITTIILKTSFEQFKDVVNQPFVYHPILVTFAFVAFLPETISFAMRSAASAGKEKGELLDAHAIFAFFTKIFGLGGIFVIYYTKEKNNKEHGTSLHGQIGYACAMSLISQILGGIIITYAPISAGLKQTMKKVHAFFGYVLALTASAAFWLGMQTTYGMNVIANKNEVLGHVYSFAVLLVIASVSIFGGTPPAEAVASPSAGDESSGRNTEDKSRESQKKK